MINPRSKREANNKMELPAIPHKLYFTIGEVGKLCDLKTHVLRYWEKEFSQLNPSKRRGNRRYYQRKDVLLLRRIKELLYQQGFTIEGARAQLIDEPVIEGENHALTDHVTTQNNEWLQKTIADLECLLNDLSGHNIFKME